MALKPKMATMDLKEISPSGKIQEQMHSFPEYLCFSMFVHFLSQTPPKTSRSHRGLFWSGLEHGKPESVPFGARPFFGSAENNALVHLSEERNRV